jgi:LPPG:FO 2-phospho-L-lactate transferase
VTARVTERFGIGARLLPMSDDPVTTRISVVEAGVETELHFQEYWVARRARDEVKTFRFDGVERARPAPGVLAAIRDADTIVICPSNPVVSVEPILAVRGIREAVAARRDRVVGISPIVGGAPLAGMADRLMPVAGLEVSALGAARAYEGLLAAWVVDRADEALVETIADALGVVVASTDTVMRDDDVSEALARFALGLLDT